jgi:hypothetical protein
MRTMPETARRHFDEDIARAERILESADTFAGRLQSDMRISAIALAVGAMDAYLCDAYVDCLSNALRAYFIGNWSGRLPSHYANQQLPAGEILDNSRTIRPLWSIRMAARKTMERNDMLSLSRLKDHFNPILPPNEKIWVDFLPRLLSYGHKRLTGPLTEEEIAGLKGDALNKANNKAISVLKRRIASIIQIRHDWIHNCARPRESIHEYTKGEAEIRIRHIRYFICELDNHLEEHRLA